MRIVGFYSQLFEKVFDGGGEVGHFLLLLEEVGSDRVEVWVIKEGGLL